MNIYVELAGRECLFGSINCQNNKIVNKLINFNIWIEAAVILFLSCLKPNASYR